ncbi:MAG: tyrosine-type recombinase/integrase [Planctomycetota bacterium]
MPKKPALGLPPYVRQRASGFRAVLRINATRHYGPTMRTAQEAHAYALRFLEIHEKRGDTAPVLSVAQGCQRLLDELQRSGARPDTIDFYAKYLRVFRKQWGDDRPLHQVGQRDLRLYIVRRERQVKPQTLYQKELQVAGRLFRFAIAEGLLFRNPLEGVRSPRIRKGQFRAMTQDDVMHAVDGILASGFPQCRMHADIVLLLFFTGLRLAEVGRLRVRDYVVDGKAATLFVDGKTDNRHQPVPQALRASIDRLAAGKKLDDPLLGVGNRRLTSRVMELWRHRLGLPHFSAHVMRHSYATAMARLGVDQFRLQALMGHRSITQTARYYHAASPDLQDAAELLGDRKPARRGSRARRATKPASRAASRPTRGTPAP